MRLRCLCYIHCGERKLAACAQASPPATLSRATRSSRWEHVVCQLPVSWPQSALVSRGVPKTLWVACDQLARGAHALRRQGV